MKDYYRILNVPTDATVEIIKSSYRKLAKQYHPDTNRNDIAAAELFADVCEAYSVLSDTATRAAYDIRRRQENAQEQLSAVHNRAYREGYACGYKAGQLCVTKQLSDNEQNRRELEQELFNRDRELAKAQNVICELLTQLGKWHLGDENFQRNKNIGLAYLRHAKHLNIHSATQK